MMTITQGFKRGDKHTKDFELWLVNRSAPTPSEKSIVEDVPFMQGVYDFSTILGERVYQNRTLSFEFEYLQQSYEKRKVDQTVLENWLMLDGYTPLYDDHAEGYFYIAKCNSVEIDDSSGGLTIKIDFDAYPFKKAIREEGNDIWDVFNFNLDVSQPIEYTVDSILPITLWNVGSVGVSPVITATNRMTIIKNGNRYNVPAGQSRSEDFRLEIGENPLTITGNGKIKFSFFKELI